MPDQFSSEYVDYVLSDGAKGLQEKWEPKVCDWCIALDKATAGTLGYVARWQVADKDGSHRSTWVVVVTPDSGVGYISGGSQAAIKENFAWLPALRDLLRIIEGAGCVWGRKTDGDWYAWPEGSALTEYITRSEKDHPLAAAKLAVKALEGK